MKSIIATGLSALAFIGSAHAVSNNLGFEAGVDSGWTLSGNPNASLSSVTGYSIDYSADLGLNPGEYVLTVAPVVGNSLGVLSTFDSDPDVPSAAVATYSFSSPTVGVDTLWVRFATPDFYDLADFLQLDFTFLSGSSTSVTLKGADLFHPATGEFDVDTGWFGIAVPTKTTSITLTLSNGQDGLFAPTAFIDYEKAKITPPPVVAVPEPGTYALMAACLGVLGLSMRRAQRPTV